MHSQIQQYSSKWWYCYFLRWRSLVCFYNYLHYCLHGVGERWKQKICRRTKCYTFKKLQSSGKGKSTNWIFVKLLLTLLQIKLLVEQIPFNPVALSGSNIFQCTRGLILNVSKKREKTKQCWCLINFADCWGGYYLRAALYSIQWCYYIALI